MHSLQRPRIGATTRTESDRVGPARPGVGKQTLVQAVEATASSGPGRPLPDAFRVRMERVFGVNFAAVRVHDDPAAMAMGARAFTRGTDIHVAPGQYDPTSPQGQELLGHELAHVVQQASGRAPADTAHADPALEQAADDLGGRAVHDEHASGPPVPAAPIAVTATPAVQFKLFRAGHLGQDDQDIERGEVVDVDDLLQDEHTGTVYRYVGDYDHGEKIALRGHFTNELYLYDFATDTVYDRDRYENRLGRGLAGRMQAINQGQNDPTRGVHYEHTFQHDFPQAWNPNYVGGHADPTMFVKLGEMRWQLVPGQRASVALRRWLDGLTIAECATVLVALQLRQVLDVVGEVRFDQLFGSDQPHVQPQAQRLLIAEDLSDCLPNIDNLIRPINNLRIGAKYYFKNCRQYLRKHPDGPLRGENAVYLGVDHGQHYFEGFGIPQATSAQIFNILHDAYNDPRTEGDYQFILYHDTTDIPHEWLQQQELAGHTYRALYQRCVDRIHPDFRISNDLPEQMERGAWRNSGAGIEGGSFVLDAEQLIKLGLGI